jgi:mannosyltransferase
VIALLAITLVGLGIRLWSLDAAGVWFDEAYHVALVRVPDVGGMLDAIMSNPPADPLYPLLLRGWVALAGHGDAAIRVPSVVFATFAIPAAYWLAREVDGRRAVALIGALFVALSTYALEFAKEAAPYSLAALTTTLALAALWHWRRTGGMGDGFLAVGLGIVAVYSHYVAAVILVLAWLIGTPAWVGPSRVGRGPWFLALAAVLLAWTPWLVGLAGHWLASAAPRASLESPVSPAQVLGALAQYGVGTAALLEGVRPLLTAGLVVGGLLAALGWLAGGDPDRRGLRVLVVTAAIVFVTPAVGSALTGTWLFVAHFGLFMLPAMLVVAAAGVAEGAILIGERYAVGRWLAGGFAVAWSALALAGVGLFFAAPPHGADGLRELVANLEADAAPGDVVLVAPAILTPSLAQYTDRRLTGIPAEFDLWDIYGPAAFPASDERLRTATRSAVAGRDRVWLISRVDLAADRVIRTELGATHSLETRFDAEFAALFRYRAPTE